MPIDPEKYQALFQQMQPDIEEAVGVFETTPVGSKFWHPCAGVDIYGIKCGHIGNVRTYKGNREWELGEWIGEADARSQEITITDSCTRCPYCSEIVNSSSV